MDLYEGEVLCICHPDWALDAEMILAVFSFHNVIVTPDKYVPRDQIYFIRPSQLVMPPPTFQFTWDYRD